MPGGDGTGPLGLGPRTGRGMGYCAGYNRPGFMVPGIGRRFFRRGFRFWARTIPVINPYTPVTRDDERRILENEKRALEEEIKAIKKEIEAIEKRLKELKGVQNSKTEEM